MTSCTACSAEIQEGSRYCPGCGLPARSDSLAPTAVRRDAPGDLSSGSLDQGMFTAGTMLAGRYRIIGLLGRGGMGEVYRADDLKLGQPVALKFLPGALSRDAGRLSRFHSEVRIARQVSHPNVCRVYDIGEVDGHHYLSMEYVDGEDLASLLRRIGRFSQDKAIEIARQICAGLAAAHDKGVIHRDLKPANVMLDGRGKVRITDFGLASIAAEISGAEARVGTPAYMSPEQIRGGRLTSRSDLYSLGLVLYEMFTGKPAQGPGSLAATTQADSGSSAASPSSHVGDLDPAVERVILRCLQQDPDMRPPSALAVAAALPGADPLAAALAAGETPSPEMVADAGEEGGLRPAVAAACLAGVLVFLGLAALITNQVHLVGKVPVDLPRDALTARARQIVATLGETTPAVDTAGGFMVLSDYLRHIRDTDSSPDRWRRLSSGRPPTLAYWYRQSPRQMIGKAGFSAVRLGDPPLVLSGMTNVVLDLKGRLISYDAVPPQLDETEHPGGETDWSVLFDLAEMDPASFTRVDPVWTPLVNTDERAAWEGTLPEAPDVTIRLEAGSYRGRPVSFKIRGPWSRPGLMKAAPLSTGDKIQQYLGFAVTLIGVVGAIFLARRNLRLGRGDTTGAFKLAFFFLAVHVSVWAMWVNHTPDLTEEWSMFVMDTGYSLFLASILWLLYVALEPFVRRRWPQALIGWSRLLEGRVRDPLVGRDILMGVLGGSAACLIIDLTDAIPAWLGWAPPIPESAGVGLMSGLSMVVPEILDKPVHGVLQAMQALFLFLILRIVLRKAWLAAGAFVAIFALVVAGGNDYPAVVIPFAMIVVGMFTWILLRFGLLALTLGSITIDTFQTVFMTVDPGQWYATGSLMCVIVLVSLAAYGFQASLAGKPILSGAILES